MLSARSVFTDDSGRRTRLMQWTARGAVALILGAGALMVLSLTSHVSLPGLGSPLSGVSRDRTSEVAKAPAPHAPAHRSTARTFDPTPTLTPTDPTTTAVTTTRTVATAQAADPAPTNTPSAVPTQGESAAHRAEPTHAPTAPPGKTR
jgi:hypothetical protein